MHILTMTCSFSFQFEKPCKVKELIKISNYLDILCGLEVAQTLKENKDVHKVCTVNEIISKNVVLT